jgi:type I restriction enzyme S subunit
MSNANMQTLEGLVFNVTDKTAGQKDATKPYVGLENISSFEGSLTGWGSAADSSSTNNVFQAGDVLFGKLRPQLHKCVRVPFDGYCSTDILVLRPHSGVVGEFAGRVLQSDAVFAQAIRTEEGTKMPRTSWEAIRCVEVFAPPDEAEQRKIARILTTVDRLIEETETLIAKHQAIKQGMMHDLFTRGVDAEGQLRPTHAEAPDLYNHTLLGWIPKEWWVASVGDLFEKRREHGRAGLPVMSVVMKDGLVERSSVERRVESNLPPEGHALVLKGDIAYNMMRMWQGVLGRAAFDCLVSPAYVVLKPKDTINTHFAALLFSDPHSILKFRQFSQGVVDDRLRLYFHDLVKIPFAVPRSLEEQQAIADRIEACKRNLAQEKATVDKYRNLRLGLKQALLTGKVRVKVDDGEEVAAHA